MRGTEGPLFLLTVGCRGRQPLTCSGPAPPHQRKEKVLLTIFSFFSREEGDGGGGNSSDVAGGQHPSRG